MLSILLIKSSVFFYQSKKKNPHPQDYLDFNNDFIDPKTVLVDQYSLYPKFVRYIKVNYDFEKDTFIN